MRVRGENREPGEPSAGVTGRWVWSCLSSGTGRPAQRMTVRRGKRRRAVEPGGLRVPPLSTVVIWTVAQPLGVPASSTR